MRGPLRWSAAALLLAGAAAPAPAQNVTFQGEVRPRYEVRDPVDGVRDGFTIMRVRVGLEAAVDPDVSVFIQVQDVRLWGEESNPSGDYTADHLDLHQGYLRWRGKRLSWLTATVGRQETGFGEERLVGYSNWSSQGRAFDGVRLDAVRNRAGATFIGYKINDATAPAVSTNLELYGFYGTLKQVGPGLLELYWLHERGEGAEATREHTLGTRYVFGGPVDGRVEATIQRGRRAGDPVSAYMLAGWVGRGFAEGRAHVTLWYDYLSGDDTPGDGEVQVFSTLYGTNHKNYGFADLFTNIPTHTLGHGLQDRAVKIGWNPMPDLAVEADAHSFVAARRGTLSTPHFGDELDLTLTRRYAKGFSVSGGVSRVLQDRALAEIARLDRDMTWAFVMFDASF
jgi:Alginate export